MFVGVDGCKAGWIAVGLTENNNWWVDVFPDVSSLWHQYRQTSIILIDIPIGLKASGTQERRCDPEARKLIGPRRSSVFPTPCRPAAYASSYEEASRINERLTGKRLSLETWYITPKICEVDCLLSKDKAARICIRETHPELCFWGLAGRPMKYSKKQCEGQSERTDILQSIYPQVADIIRHALATYKRKDILKDDLLDALSAAVTAMLAGQELASIPRVPEFDEQDLRMEMVYHFSTPSWFVQS